MLALTCKAAFEAYEQSDCLRLEAEVSKQKNVKHPALSGCRLQLFM